MLPTRRSSTSTNATMRNPTSSGRSSDIVPGTHALRGLVAALALGAAISTAAAPLHAQDDVEDYIAYFALLTTPKGALSPLAPAEARSALTFRYGRNEVLDVAGEDGGAFNNFGLTFSPRMGPGRLDLTLGAVTCDGCDGNILAEVGYEGTLLTSPMGTGSLTFGVRPAFGYGRSTESGVNGNSMSLSGELPVALNVGAGTAGRLSLFVTPGFAWGRMSEDGESIDGTRPMLSGGAHFGTAGGFGVTAGVQKVFIDEGKATLGIGVSFPLGGR